MAEEVNTELQIKEAAKKVFVQKGFTGARMQEIADEAGINKALVHYYFRNKEKLFDVIFQETFDTALPRLTEVIGSDQPLLEKIERFVKVYIRTIRENPHLPMFIINELNRHPDRLIHRIKAKMTTEHIFQIMTEMQQAVAAGTIRPVHPFHLFMNILSLCAFPFIAKPLLLAVTNMDNPVFEAMMAERETEVLQFLRRALLPNEP